MGRMEEAKPILERALDIEGRVYDLDDVTHGEERASDDNVHLKEVTLPKDRKRKKEKQ
jgi:hypothetical protein